MTGSMPASHGLCERGQRLRRMAHAVTECPSPMRRLLMIPLRERLAVALILDRRDLFIDAEFTILQAIEFLGEEWVRLAMAVQRADMQDMED